MIKKILSAKFLILFTAMFVVGFIVGYSYSLSTSEKPEAKVIETEDRSEEETPEPDTSR